MKRRGKNWSRAVSSGRQMQLQKKKKSGAKREMYKNEATMNFLDQGIARAYKSFTPFIFFPYFSLLKVWKSQWCPFHVFPLPSSRVHWYRRKIHVGHMTTGRNEFFSFSWTIFLNCIASFSRFGGHEKYAVEGRVEKKSNKEWEGRRRTRGSTTTFGKNQNETGEDASFKWCMSWREV